MRKIFFIIMVCILMQPKNTKAEDAIESYGLQRFMQAFMEITVGDIYWLKKSEAQRVVKALDNLCKYAFIRGVNKVTNNMNKEDSELGYCLLGLDYKEVEEKTLEYLSTKRIQDNNKYLVALIAVSLDICNPIKLSDKEFEELISNMEKEGKSTILR